MAIEVKCSNPQCGKIYRVKDEAAGKKFKCKQCQTVLVVPAAPGKQAMPPAPAADAASQFKPQASQHHPARLTCTNCGAVLGVRDAICPGCGGDVRSGVTIMRITPEEKEKMGIFKLFGTQKKGSGVAPKGRGRRRSANPVAVLVIILIVIGAVIGAVIWSRSSGAAAAEPEHAADNAPAATTANP